MLDHTFQSASDTAERLIVMTAERDALATECESTRNAMKIYSSALITLEGDVRDFLDEHLEPESELISITFEEANEFLNGHEIAPLTIERSYDVSGSITFEFSVRVDAQDEEEARAAVENCYFSLDCNDYEYDAHEDHLQITEVIVSE
jgi:hypothetical protein